MPTAGQFAEYFKVTARLGPYMPELLQDFHELGSFPDLIAAMLGRAGLAEGSRVLDLGCGKGAVSVEVARELGARVEGVDLCEAFLTEARRLAAAEGVADRCLFTAGDLREAVRTARGFDGVVFAAVGDVLGGLEETIGALRQCVRPGGAMVLDDGYALRPERIDFPGYEYLATREETLRQLTAHGDEIVEEDLISPEAQREQNRLYNRRLEHRARELTARRPELAPDVAAYIRKEHEECRLLEESVQCATWLLRRAAEPDR